MQDDKRWSGMLVALVASCSTSDCMPVACAYPNVVDLLMNEGGHHNHAVIGPTVTRPFEVRACQSPVMVVVVVSVTEGSLLLVGPGLLWTL